MSNTTDYRSNCDVLSISSYSSDSKNTQTLDGGNGSDSEDFYTPYDIIAAATATAAGANQEYRPYPLFDPNDPLRYFMELGQVTPNEYEKWKIVSEEPCCQILQPCPPVKHKRKTPDFGPGYNSDSDPDSDNDSDNNNDNDNDDDNGPTIEYGNGYSAHADEHNDPFDPWNPTPDPTSDKRYTKLANDGAFMLKRLTQGRNLASSFRLKLAWERFTTSPLYHDQTLQDFWQENALQIYEALRDLVEARTGGAGAGAGGIGMTTTPITATTTTPACEQYHSTPSETLDNTFETIGRMCRCIAEEFNTPSIVAYVEEFLVSLYREIEFDALVKAAK
jgi:hypothetical protein